MAPVAHMKYFLCSPFHTGTIQHRGNCKVLENKRHLLYIAMKAKAYRMILKGKLSVSSFYLRLAGTLGNLQNLPVVLPAWMPRIIDKNWGYLRCA
jgi:hypothetical protein